MVRPLCAAALALCSSFACAISEVLLVQLKTPNLSKDAQATFLAYMAQELDDEGRVIPIAWSLSDPVFRAAVDDRHVTNPETFPDLDAAQQMASKLRIQYVLAFQIWRKEGMCYSRAKLYRAGKEVWKDPDVTDIEIQNRRTALENQRKNAQASGAEVVEFDQDLLDSRTLEVSVGRAGLDFDSTYRSLARTYSHLLGAGPLKAYPARPRAKPTEENPAQKPIEVVAPPPTQVDNQALLQQVMQLLASGKGDEALGLLRDAVDAEPMDIERRRALISSLSQLGRQQQAAEEARRAAALLPAEIGFRLMAARAWLALDNLAEATNDLNEAVARAPQSAETRMLLAEIHLFKAEPEPALSHLDFLAESSPSVEVFVRRALAQALQGHRAEAEADLLRASEAGLAKDPPGEPARFALCAQVVDPALVRLGDAGRELMQRARAKPEDPEAATEQRDLLARAEAIAAVLGALPAPAKSKPSAEHRLLALRLFAQSFADLGSFLTESDPELLTDATINLGEAIKAAKIAQELAKG